MGLDQYASARKGESTKRENKWTSTKADGTQEEHVEYSDEWEDSYDLADWRKHPNLQGWMEGLYYEKGGDGDFNCDEVELDLDDLDALEEALSLKELPETAGFFFGENANEHYAEADKEFVANAREAIKNGYTVVYSSWW